MKINLFAQEIQIINNNNRKNKRKSKIKPKFQNHHRTKIQKSLFKLKVLISANNNQIRVVLKKVKTNFK